MNITSKGFKKPLATEGYDIAIINENTQLANDLIEDIEDGTAAVGNASKLGGQLPNYYATAEQINNFANNKADLVDGKVPSDQLPNIEVPVKSVNSKIGAVVLTKSDIGLGNVDNTADSAKNVLSATKLTTARTINGISFDGQTNITIPIEDSTKAPINHVSTGTSYGIGTTTSYGHVKIINDLTHSSFVNGEALSAYQGKLLNDKISSLSVGEVTYTNSIPANSTLTKIIPIGADKTYGKLFCTQYGSTSITGAYAFFCTNENNSTGLSIMDVDRIYIGNYNKNGTTIWGDSNTTGNNNIVITKIYINSSNLYIVFQNTNTSSSYSLYTKIIWEVY